MSTIYLRTKTNKTIADIEVTAADVQSVVPIMVYSHFLLRTDPDKLNLLIQDMDFVQNLRAWYHEVLTPSRKTYPSVANNTKDTLDIIRPIAERWDLAIVTD